MSVKVKRCTGWVGSGSQITVLVNGEKKASVVDGQETEVEISAGKSHLRVGQLGAKSNELEVHNGDTVEISTSKTSMLFFYVLWLLPLIFSILRAFFESNFFPILFVVLLLFSLSISLFRFYQIKTINFVPTERVKSKKV